MLRKISRSLIKLILPLISKILIKLKLNRRVINYLSEKSYKSNDTHNFIKLISSLLKDEKIIALDVGAQGGFNSDNFFSSKYNFFFEEILVEPIKSESEKLKKNKFVINKGLWSVPAKKKLYILDKRLGSSSMYKPHEKSFDLHNIKIEDYEKYKITREVEIDCDTISNQLKELQINNLDYLKIDTQGAELDILKGIGKYRPLLIKVEAHFFSLYENVPSWHKLNNFLYELNYVLIDLKGIGDHSARVPAEADLIFIPNFCNHYGKEIIAKNKEKFCSLMLIFGQIKLLQTIVNKLNINLGRFDKIEDHYFN